MKLIRVFCLICIFPYAGFTINLKGSPENLVKQADSLFMAQEYRMSALFYEKAAYKSTDEGFFSRAILKKTACLWKLKEYSKAYNLLGRIPITRVNDTLQFETGLARASSAYFNREFELAKSDLIQLYYFTPDTNLRNQCLPLFVLVHNELEEWNEAKEKATQLVYASNMSDSEKLISHMEIIRLYSGNRLPKLKNPTKAANLSTFLPGIGQLYAGYFWEGVANVSFQALGLGAVVVGIITQYYVGGAVVGFTIFQRFYAGGISRAEFLANKKNFELKQEFSKRTIETIKNKPITN